MSNMVRFGISALVSGIVALIGYMLPFTLLLYFFAPGFWLGDALSDSQVNSLGGYLFPVFASILFWTFLIFGIWWLMARSRSRR
jgi:hypothetical protein